MARHEADREDILREATALVQRAELSIPGRVEPVIVGFRRDGCASLFFGPDPVYQFNTRSELRRAYLGGELVKAESGRLVSLRRERTADEVQLLRRELPSAEQEAALAAMRHLLDELQASLADGNGQLLRQHPPDVDVPSAIRAWLSQLPPTIAVAERPNAQ